MCSRSAFSLNASTHQALKLVAPRVSSTFAITPSGTRMVLVMMGVISFSPYTGQWLASHNSSRPLVHVLSHMHNRSTVRDRLLDPFHSSCRVRLFVRSISYSPPGLLCRSC